MSQILIKPQTVKDAATKLSAIETRLQDTSLVSQMQNCLSVSEGAVVNSVDEVCTALKKLQDSMLQLTQKTKQTLTAIGVEFEKVDSQLAKTFFN